MVFFVGHWFFCLLGFLRDRWSQYLSIVGLGVVLNCLIVFLVVCCWVSGGFGGATVFAVVGMLLVVSLVFLLISPWTLWRSESALVLAVVLGFSFGGYLLILLLLGPCILCLSCCRHIGLLLLSRPRVVQKG